MKIAFAGLHSGEEPPIARSKGSGTIFFSGCTLACSFCQNCQISHEGTGAEISITEFAEICLHLQKFGAENINLVTGTHFLPSISAGIHLAREQGLDIPIVWNTSSWESAEGLEILKSFVDIYLPDIKTFDSSLSSSVFKAPDYPLVAQRAIRKMVKFAPLRSTNRLGEKNHGKEAISLVCEDPIANRLDTGVILRHLILPDRLSDTANILSWFAQTLKDRAILSLMTQYTPVGDAGRIPSLRYLKQEEYNAVQELLEEHNIDEGFFQDLLPGSDWLPDFYRTNPFSSELSQPIWHWQTGYIEREQLKN